MLKKPRSKYRTKPKNRNQAAENEVLAIKDAIGETNLADLYSTDKKTARRLAKIDYFNFVEPPVIAARYGIKIATVMRWICDYRGSLVDKGWKVQRDSIFGGYIDAIILNKQKDIKDIMALSLANLKRALTSLYAREDPISITEMQKLMMIIGEGEKLMRLEAGQPTDILATIDLTPSGLKKIMDDIRDADPYVTYEAQTFEDEDLN